MSPKPGTHYGIVNVRINADGFGMSLPPPFCVFHPRLFIPWSAISEVVSLRRWFWTDTTVFVEEPAMRLLFHGNVGSAICQAWTDWAARNKAGQM